MNNLQLQLIMTKDKCVINRDSLRLYWPSDTESTIYSLDSENIDPLFELIKNKWPGTKIKHVNMELLDVSIPRFRSVQLNIPNVLRLIKTTRVIGIKFNSSSVTVTN